MLVNKVLALVLVVVQHDALQQCIGEGELAHLILGIGANIEQELVVGVVDQLRLDAILNLLTEVSLVLYGVLTVNLVEQLLVYLCLNVA